MAAISGRAKSSSPGQPRDFNFSFRNKKLPDSATPRPPSASRNTRTCGPRAGQRRPFFRRPQTSTRRVLTSPSRKGVRTAHGAAGERRWGSQKTRSYRPAAETPRRPDTARREGATRAERSRLGECRRFRPTNSARRLPSFKIKKRNEKLPPGVSQGSRPQARPDMVPGPWLGGSGPPAAARLLRWGLGCGRASCSRLGVRTFPAPARSLRRRSGGGTKKKKQQNFSLVTPPGIAVRDSLPAWVKKQDPARGPGSRNPGAARRRGGGDGARPEPRGPGAAHGGRGLGAPGRPAPR